MSEQDMMEALIQEHAEMRSMLSKAVDAMNITKHLFDLRESHILVASLREIEGWLDKHQHE